MHITVKKHGRQKLVRREKITLPGLKRQKQLVWNLACSSEKSFQPEVQVKEGTAESLLIRKTKVLCLTTRRKLIFSGRELSRDLSGTADRRLLRHDSVSARDILLISHLFFFFIIIIKKRTEGILTGGWSVICVNISYVSLFLTFTTQNNLWTTLMLCTPFHGWILRKSTFELTKYFSALTQTLSCD